MRKILFILLLFTSISISAQKHFSPEEYRAKQQEYITKRAELTPDEAEKFFPIFFELQEKKWEINGEAWKQIPRNRDTEMTDEECEILINGLAEVKIKEAQLEKEYLAKYKAILPAKKILRIQQAEEGFQRDLLKKMIEGRSKDNNQRDRRNPSVEEEGGGECEESNCWD